LAAAWSWSMKAWEPFMSIATTGLPAVIASHRIRSSDVVFPDPVAPRIRPCAAS
jgi:hypothetical protein